MSELLRERALVLMRAPGSFALAALPTLLAVCSALAMFSLFLLAQDVSPLEALRLMFKGAFGSSFAWANSLQRAAPLMLTALCVALPARAGLVVIGGEGALALGGLAAGSVAVMAPSLAVKAAVPLMVLMGALIGGLWIAFAGMLRQWRGVNETIGSLLLSYLGIALFNHLVEGALRDPASLNKPSTLPLPESWMVGAMPGLEVHWGFAFGAAACVLAWIFLRWSVPGFALNVVGGNVNVARLVGLPVDRLVIGACFAGGAAAGIAGAFEVAAVQGSANASLLSGYGYAGILVAFAARQNPLAVIVCAVLVGGIGASGSLLQRRLGLPDAATLVLQGLIFANLLAWEALQGRLANWQLRLSSLGARDV
ncbi:nucleoside ABC transporter membrane protein [Solimonas aquatica]|uniref:Nucleoside ABC transporter membrane protein n=1 Tax=Solimonas aquatica TaxID=489703 RepID=A0A1H9DQJ9_9GAMM|nr:ABC transporter permease [Solimonas aquatica]SEQ14983.1 nucleoside ABC transporter membrane protein [Solimonas aquatica]